MAAKVTLLEVEGDKRRADLNRSVFIFGSQEDRPVSVKDVEIRLNPNNLHISMK